MVKENLSLEQVHFAHRTWNNELDFSQDEVNIYEHRLSILVKQGYDREMMRGLEHFQNQFIRQKEVIDQLHHDINLQEHQVVEMIQAEKNDTSKIEKGYQDLMEQMERFRKIFNELKQEFYQYLAKWK